MLVDLVREEVKRTWAEKENDTPIEAVSQFIGGGRLLLGNNVLGSVIVRARFQAGLAAGRHARRRVGHPRRA
jgi:hypothetical protein